MQNHRENLLNNAERLKKGKILGDEAVEFYSDLFDFQYKKASLWIELNLFPDLNLGKNISIEQGPIVLADPAVEELSKSIAELAAIIEKYNQGINMQDAVRESGSNRKNIEKIIGLLLKKEPEMFFAMSKSAGIDFEEYIFLIVNWLKPLFIALREKCGVKKTEEHKDASCPFCGYYPDMSVISAEREGRRFLRCGLCENLWPYKRIACAVCGSADAKQLEYFADEKNDRYRMDVCNSCRGYIKTIRLDKMEEIEKCDLTVENILSAPLEGQLLERGFKRL